MIDNVCAFWWSLKKFTTARERKSMQGLGASRCPVPEHSPSRWSVRPWGDSSTIVWAVQVATYKVYIIPSIVRTVADLWLVVDDLSAHFTHPMLTLGQWVIQQWSKPNESNQIHWMGAELFIKSKTELGKMWCNRNHCQFGVYSTDSNAFTSSSWISEIKKNKQKNNEKICINNWNPLHT